MYKFQWGNNVNTVQSQPRRWTTRNLTVLLACAFAIVFAAPGWAAGAAADGPTVLKNTVHVGVWQLSGAWGPTGTSPDFKYNSWFPDVKFRVHGPIPGGSQFIVDYTRPDGSAWAEVLCPTREIPDNEWINVETNRDTSTAAEKKYTRVAGSYGFKIRVKNELKGENKVLYSGKFQVASVSKNNGTPPMKYKVDYFVDHDWALPIAYLYVLPDEVQPRLGGSMWFKGNTDGADISIYLFYKGKQIGSTKEQGSASTSEAEVRTVSGDRGDPAWKLIKFEWYNIAETAKDPAQPNEKLFYLDKNPGEYEIKALRNGSLCRQTSFTVTAEGKIKSPVSVENESLSPGRYVLPIKVLGTTDGTWDKTAWKTGAFYGNPIKDFVAP